MGEDKNIIKSVDKAFRIIELMAQESRPMGVTEISKRLKINKSTVHATLNTLLGKGYFEQDAEGGKYRLGIAFAQIANASLNSMDFRNKAKPVIARLSKQINETVHMVILRQGKVVYIEKQESVQSMRIHTEIGKSQPCHCTGVGKVMLAWMDPEESKQLIREHGLPRLTDKTITDEAALYKHLEEIRQKGYAIDDEENEKGLRCVAAPIMDYSGRVIAAISIAGPTTRISTDSLEKMAELVVEAGLEISSKLGSGLTN
ncbi:IclR family transcriptional regulator [Desulfitibacter alkalitolerans]|uniref:IclR family transcriptional regulator n=1 Tax=Desulfitibacter alkalitolerans TaxID=264641 RepID=UPI000486F14F|nr:IclR family transcriptional regulator [Desulfitibacter alkalitolerans]